MNFLEKDLEQIIFETNNDVLNEKGLSIYGKKLRQVRIGNYGTADLITIERPTLIDFDNLEKWFTVTLYELKLKKINIDTVIQSLRYLKGIKRYLEKRYIHAKVKFNIVLIGQSIDVCYFIDYLMDLENQDVSFSFYTYVFNINGLFFNKKNLSLSLVDEGFEKIKKPIIKNDIQKPKLKTVSDCENDILNYSNLFQ